MATKWSELRERLPAVNELLETPPLRRLTDRWNRSVVAAGVRSFMHELRSDIERRRAEGHLPSITELAARAAQHVVRLQQPSVRPAINASGRLLDSQWAVRPLAQDALQQFVALAHGYSQAPDSSDRPCAVTAAICRLTGAEAALVVHSYSGALWLVLAALASDRDVLVARAEVGEVEPGISLADLASAAGATLREVGAVNRVSAADYEAAVKLSPAILLRHTPDSYVIAGEKAEVELEELVATARENELALVDAIGSGPLIDGLPGVEVSLHSAAASIAAGANVVLARGDGLVGGPACGMVLGHRNSIERIEQHPLFAAWKAHALTAAALYATLEHYEDPQRLRVSVPLFELLSISADNLRHRAEHLAPQLARARDVAAAEAVATKCRLGIAGCHHKAIPSYGVALSPADGNVESLDQRLRSAATPIFGRREGDRLVIDLRGVFPSQDLRLVELIAGGEGAANREESPQPVAGA